MCHQAETTLWSKPSSAPAARQWVSDRLDAWHLDGNHDGIRLVTTELVTNALHYSQTTIGLALSVARGSVEIRVYDGARTPLPRRRPRSDATTGRGLLMIERTCDDWGVVHTREGKHVWARFDLPDGPPCACDTKTPERGAVRRR